MRAVRAGRRPAHVDGLSVCCIPCTPASHDVSLQIDAKKSVPLEQKPKARKIFVGGLAPETTEGEDPGGRGGVVLRSRNDCPCMGGQCHYLHCAEQFKAYFERFGEVAEAQIMLDHMSGRSRGFG